jgi:ankyrin repeat protein
MVLSKAQLELQLHNEAKDISDGKFKDDNPLDLSQDFQILCQACRRGDLKLCQEAILAGANINARDEFDYTPLILVSRLLSRIIVHEANDSRIMADQLQGQSLRTLRSGPAVTRVRGAV